MSTNLLRRWTIIGLTSCVICDWSVFQWLIGAAGMRMFKWRDERTKQRVYLVLFPIPVSKISPRAHPGIPGLQGRRGFPVILEILHCLVFSSITEKTALYTWYKQLLHVGSIIARCLKRRESIDPASAQHCGASMYM